MSLMQEIAEIDRALKLLYRDLKKDNPRAETSGDWQDIWNRNPTIHKYERKLYAQRGMLQQELAIQRLNASIKIRPHKPKRCPYCKNVAW